MSTRGFLTFVIDGVEKTTYNHSDSYPGGLGLDTLSFLRARRHEMICDRHRGTMGATVDRVRALRVVSEDTRPTQAEIEALRGWARLDVGRGEWTDWYVLLRGTQGDPAEILDAGVLLDAADFPADSLFAEWGYVIDLDTRRFEVYQGFQKQPHNKGRFATRQGEGTGYYPVALVASWPLDALPNDEEFAAACADTDPDDE